jgi:hypothetical protein
VVRSFFEVISLIGSDETKGKGFLSRFTMRHQQFAMIRKVALKGRCMDNYFPKEKNVKNKWSVTADR